MASSSVVNSPWSPTADRKGKRKAAEESEQRRSIILCLDQDNFYVSCERVLNPALQGQPVGIQQKQILATCSYEARACGVTKLCLLSEGLELCPDMIIVSGEDLTHYRAFSRRIFALVRLILGEEVAIEKLGMDELFCDITHAVHRHVSTLSNQDARVSDSSGKTWWALANADPPESTDLTPESGFWYDSQRPAGHLDPPLPADNWSTNDPMLLASHLAAHIRQCISLTLGFPSSAGVASSKLVSKLLSERHKPNDQTTWNSFANITESEYVSEVEISKVQGFGFKAFQKLREELEPFDGPWTLGAVRSQCRANLGSFTEWFGDTTGSRLWNLLHGIDNSTVNNSNEWPAQIGVEDSFRPKDGSLAWTAWLPETNRLALSLVRRLDGELRCERKKWLRWPRKIRLTVLLRKHTRVGRTVDMPTEVFGEDMIERVAAVSKALQPLWKGACGGNTQGNLHIINITASHLSSEAPGTGLRAWLGNVDTTQSPSRWQAGTTDYDSVDPSFLDALPPEIRDELLQDMNRQAKMHRDQTKGARHSPVRPKVEHVN